MGHNVTISVSGYFAILWTHYPVLIRILCGPYFCLGLLPRGPDFPGAWRMNVCMWELAPSIVKCIRSRGIMHRVYSHDVAPGHSTSSPHWTLSPAGVTSGGAPCYRKTPKNGPPHTHDFGVLRLCCRRSRVLGEVSRTMNGVSLISQRSALTPDRHTTAAIVGVPAIVHRRRRV